MYSDGTIVVHDVIYNIEQNPNITVSQPTEEINKHENDWYEEIFKNWKYPFNPQVPYFYPTKNCPKCGINTENLTGYYCPNYDCPTQPKVWCGC